MTFKHGRYWWTWIPTSRGTSVRRSLKTTNKVRADQIERMIASWKDQARWELLDAIASKSLSVDRAFIAYQHAQPDALVAELAAEQAAKESAAAAGPSAQSFIERWATWLAGQGRRPQTVEAYVRQVRAVLGETDVTLSQLTRQWLRGQIANVGVKQTNRYRSAVSAFCAWLVDEDRLERNPVRDIRRIAESAPRDRHLLREDALKLLDALPAPYRALHALMAGTGMEISAALAVRYGDIDRAKRTVRARGTKRRHRDRTVMFFNRWLPEWERFTAHLDETPGVGNALVFPDIDRDLSYRKLIEACGQSITDYTQHDWRHTYAVQGVKDRMPFYIIAHQLGHANETMVRQVYGKFRSAGDDLAAWAESQVTFDVTFGEASRSAAKGR
jgi:integrase